MRRLVIAGALSVATAAAPAILAVTTSAASHDVSAAPPCLAWFGNKEDGKCLSYSNGQPVVGGTPSLGVYGPNAGRMPGGGAGVFTGPLMPGTTITQPIG